jgi:hypothetical protein
MTDCADTDPVEEFTKVLKANADMTAKQAQAAVQHLEAMKASIVDEQHKTKKLKTEWDSTVQLMRDNCANHSQPQRQGLQDIQRHSVQGTFFYNMLSRGEWFPDKKGEYFVDRGSEGFGRILDYLSTGKLSFEGLNKYEENGLREILIISKLSDLRLFSLFAGRLSTYLRVAY